MEQQETLQTNNSLMKKTKVQLVDIILRKDDVEAKLRTELYNANSKYYETHNKLKDSKAMCEKLLAENKTIKSKLNELKVDFENQCDAHVTDYEAFKHKLNIAYSVIVALALVTICIIIF